MRVGAVILHFRYWPEVRATIDALLSQTHSPEMITVVDNRSEDGSAEKIRDSYPSIDVLVASSNGGYAAGMNLGVRSLLRSGMEGLLLLTHECLLAADTLERLTRRLQENPSLGAVGPVLGYLTKPEIVFSAGGRIDTRTWDTRHVREPRQLKEWKGRPPYRVKWLDGAALLMRASAVRQAGLLDEGYFLRFEEVEYLLRFERLEWGVECVPEAVAWQEPGPPDSYLLVRNRLRFLARNAPKRFLVRELARVVFYIVRDALDGRDSPRGRVVRRLLGLWHFILRRRGPPPGAGPHGT